MKHFLVCGTKFSLDCRYKLETPLGQGAFGVVCSAIDQKTKKKVAIKKITDIFSNLNQAKRTLREVRLLRHFCHDNIIKIVEILNPPSYEDFRDIYVVTEFMESDVHQIITSPQELTDEHLQFFIYQLLRGLKYIHSAHVLHRDLKPSNLLINGDCSLKICDFGLARVVLPQDTHIGYLTEYVATRWYRAPEIMLSSKVYTKAVDVWSVGCIFAELLWRKPLFPGRDYMHQLQLIIEKLGTPSVEDSEYIASAKAKQYIRSLPYQPGVPFSKLFPHASPLALDLLQKMLSFSPDKRISVEEALSHPYLAAYHDPNDEPTADKKFDETFEQLPESKEALKMLLWNEICLFHPQLHASPAVPMDEKQFPGDFSAPAPSPPPHMEFASMAISETPDDAIMAQFHPAFFNPSLQPSAWHRAKHTRNSQQMQDDD